MHGQRPAHDLAPEDLADGLMTEADAEYRQLAGRGAARKTPSRPRR